MWILAKEQGYDVFNAMDVMDNHDVYEELNFTLGSGSIYFYLYNWNCEPMHPEKVGFIF